MDERGDLPFKAEYAKSGRASCKRCKDSIAKDSLRLAIMVQDERAMKMTPDWFHFHCFWLYTKWHDDVMPTEIKGFNALRWEDQQKIRDMIAGGEEAADNQVIKGNYTEYQVEYAKSGRSACRGRTTCTTVRIPKGDVRVSRLEYDSEGAANYGPQQYWYCVGCFMAERKVLGFFEGMDPKKIPGFDDLEEEDQDQFVVKLKKDASKRKAQGDAAEGPSDAKKPNRDETEQERELREQNEMLWNMRDTLRKDVSVDIMQELLEFNNQVVPKQKNNILDLLSDCMMFGAFSPCEECGERNSMFSEAESQYLCVGIGKDKKPCDKKSGAPTREEFKIPGDHQGVKFLKNYKYVARTRLYPEQSVNLTPLSGMSFVIGQKTYQDKEVLRSKLESMGARVVDKPRLGLTACISSKDEFESKRSRIIGACRALKIPIITENYLHACKTGDPHTVMEAHILSDDA